jgi:CDGSH iron-sulfur domain-containing protein 3
MNKPVRAADGPYAVEVKAGVNYFWCACGRSKAQPFCDGSHKDSEFSPVKYLATDSKTLYFCGCKRTNAKPLCDGSHKQQ